MMSQSNKNHHLNDVIICEIWKDWLIKLNVKRTKWIEIWQLVRQNVIKIIWENDKISVNTLLNVNYFTFIRNKIEREHKSENHKEILWSRNHQKQQNFKIDEISNKFFNEFDFYYLIKWKNYENAIWKFASFVKYFRKTLRQFHNKNSKKFDVNKKMNYRKFKKKWNEIFIAY